MAPNRNISITCSVHTSALQACDPKLVRGLNCSNISPPVTVALCLLILVLTTFGVGRQPSSRVTPKPQHALLAAKIADLSPDPIIVSMPDLGITKALLLRDPDGHLIRLAELRGDLASLEGVKELRK